MKVIATDITNLTDARYFAAFGVDVLCYTIDEGVEGSVSPQMLKEMVDWVEGPATAIKISGLQVPEFLESLSNDIGIEKVILSPFIETTSLPESITEIHRICTLQEGWQDDETLVLTLETSVDKLTDDQIKQIKGLASKKTVYLDAIFQASDLDFIKTFGIEGIILKGGEEEKVGFKSFDELDDVLEALYEEH